MSFPDSLSRIGAVVSIGAALQDATFGSLPGVPSCCSMYGSSWNASWGVAGIVEHPLVRTLALPLLLHLRLGLQTMSGRLERDEFIGNVIVGDRITHGISRYQLDASLWAVSVEPLLRLELPEYGRLGFDVGMRLDWYVLARYAQREELISPSSGAVFETGTRTRNVFDGTIPTHALLGAAIQLGASYSISLEGTWTIRPELRAQLGLSPIADVPWRVHRLLAGIALVRRIEPTPQPELPSLPPPLPQPPLVLRVHAQLAGAQSVSGDTARVSIEARRILRRQLLVPVIFFPAGSAHLDPAAQAQIVRIARVAQERGLVLRLAPSSTPGEPDSLRLVRAHAVRNELLRWGASVTDTVILPPSPRALSPAIADELRAVWIHATEPLIEQQWQEVPLTEPVVALTLEAIAEPLPIHLDAAITENGSTATLQIAPGIPTTAQLSPVPLLEGRTTRLRWYVRARDSAGRTAEQNGAAIIHPIRVIRDTVVEGIGENGVLVLGRCSFDATTFDELDSLVIAVVRRAIEQGKRVTLIGTTDSIGTEAYNRALARRRAEAARLLLQLSPGQVRIEERVGGLNGNTSLYSRVANRGVLVRIEEP